MIALLFIYKKHTIYIYMYFGSCLFNRARKSAIFLSKNGILIVDGCLLPCRLVYVPKVLIG